MPALPLEDLRVRGVTRLITPAQIKEQSPASRFQRETVLRGREQARAIFAVTTIGSCVVVGPCSIHDPEAALDYARRLAALSRKVADRCFIIMRVYFEKPRTTVGWKGLINDPLMNDSCDMAYGLALARKILLDIADLGLPAGTEFLDPIVPQYIADLISWAAIGARTTESQTHREMASGLSMPVGFKNGTDGSVQVAIDAMKSSRTPAQFSRYRPGWCDQHHQDDGQSRQPRGSARGTRWHQLRTTACRRGLRDPAERAACARR